MPVDGMIVTSETGARCEGRYGHGQQGRMISRHRLDDALLTAARAAGACVEEGVLVRAPIVDGRPWSRAWRSSRRAGRAAVRAPIVIAADGASSRVARAPRPGATCASAAALGRWRLLRRCRREPDRASRQVRRDALATRTLHRHRAASWRRHQRLRRDRRSRRRSAIRRACCATRCAPIRRLPTALRDARPIIAARLPRPAGGRGHRQRRAWTAPGRRCRGVHRSDDRRRAALRAPRRRARRAGGARRSRARPSGRARQPGSACAAASSRPSGASIARCGRWPARRSRCAPPRTAPTGRQAGSSARSAMRATWGVSCPSARGSWRTEFTGSTRRNEAQRRRTKGRPRRATRGAYREEAGRIESTR